MTRTMVSADSMEGTPKSIHPKMCTSVPQGNSRKVRFGGEMHSCRGCQTEGRTNFGVEQLLCVVGKARDIVARPTVRVLAVLLKVDDGGDTWEAEAVCVE